MVLLSKSGSMTVSVLHSFVTLVTLVSLVSLVTIEKEKRLTCVQKSKEIFDGLAIKIRQHDCECVALARLLWRKQVSKESTGSSQNHLKKRSSFNNERLL